MEVSAAMRFKLYLGVTGDKAVIEQLGNELVVPGAESRALVPKSGPVPGQQVRWLWRTKYHAVTTNSPEDELRDFLLGHKHLFPVIDRYRSRLAEIGATIVAQYDDNEQPRGYSFSADTVRLLSELGATLEIDAVRVMAPA